MEWFARHGYAGFPSKQPLFRYFETDTNANDGVAKAIEDLLNI